MIVKYRIKCPRCFQESIYDFDIEVEKPLTNADKIRAMSDEEVDVVEVNDLDFGTVCVCALRYAMGRETYMPSLVRDYVRPLLPHLPTSTISIMVQDCESQAQYGNYGHERIDKPGWIRWEQEVRAEMKRREHDE